MTDFEFLPSIPIDAGHTLEQLTGHFQTVKDGLPELTKNSKDQYARLHVTDKEERQIIILADTEKRMLAVVDFAGASSKDLEGWQTWSSRTAGRAELATDIEAGHGNGGKAFMVRGCTDEAFIESCFNGLRTKVGFKNDDPGHRYIPAYVKESGVRTQDVREPDPEGKLNAVLRPFGLKLPDLPESCRKAFHSRRAFTIVNLNGIRDWDGRWPSTVRKLAALIPQEIANHSQATLTVETSCVWVVVDGRVVTSQPIDLRHPDPLPGLETIEPIPVPDRLVDPETGEPVDTGPEEKMLLLRTSERQLRMSESTRALNKINVRNERNFVGYWLVANLAPRAGSAFIYGELRLPALTQEHMAGADRVGFAETPLVRAVQSWVARQVDDLAHKIERTLARETRREERDKANDALGQLRELMRKFLAPEGAPGELKTDMSGGKGDGPPPEPPVPPVEWGKKVDKIILEKERKSIAMASGTRVPLEYRCYEQSERGLLPVRGAEVELITQPGGMVQMDGNRALVGLSAGKTTVWLRDTASGVESERVEVEVVASTTIDLVGPEDPLLQGQRIEVLYSFHTLNGHRDDLFLDATVDAPQFGRISRNGVFTAGFAEGIATIRVRYGPGQLEHQSLTISIGPEAIPVRGRGRGSDVPWILMCGSEAPGSEEYPADQRTHRGGEIYPTIIEEPQFASVVWVNPLSKEAVRVRPRRGPTGVGGMDTVSFYQFLALKCFEILKRLWVRQHLGDQTVTEREFTRSLAQAEMECAGFIDAAYDLAQQLHQTQ